MQPIYISEVYAKPPSATSAEWIEIYNAGTQHVMLNRAILRINDQSYVLHTNTVIPANAYFIIGNQAADFVDYEIRSLRLANTQIHIQLSCGTTLIAEKAFSAKINDELALTGRSLALESIAMQHGLPPDDDHWCSAKAEYSPGEFGSPGQENSVCGQRYCLWDTQLIQVPSLQPSELQLNEVFANPAGADKQLEWLELLNTTDRDLIINGVELSQHTPAGSLRRWSLRDPSCIRLAPQAIGLGGINTDMVHGMRTQFSFLGAELYNAQSTLRLRQQSQIVDQIDLPATVEGVSWIRSASADTAATFCQETFTVDQVYASPGMVNSTCH